jgi:hypothetical protein
LIGSANASAPARTHACLSSTLTHASFSKSAECPCAYTCTLMPCPSPAAQTSVCSSQSTPGRSFGNSLDPSVYSGHLSTNAPCTSDSSASHMPPLSRAYRSRTSARCPTRSRSTRRHCRTLSATAQSLLGSYRDAAYPTDSQPARSSPLSTRLPRTSASRTPHSPLIARTTS